jgi:hypothetical protein
MKEFVIKHKMWFIIGLVVLVLTTAYYFIFIHNATSSNLETSVDKTPSANKKAILPNPNTTLQFPIRQGDVGKQVRQLQKYLNAKYQAGLSVDGVWGEKTQTSLEKAMIPTDNPTRFYIILTLSLYNKLNLKSY